MNRTDVQRLHFLSGWSHGEAKDIGSVFATGPGACGAHGFGPGYQDTRLKPKQRVKPRQVGCLERRPGSETVAFGEPSGVVDVAERGKRGLQPLDRG